MDITKCLTISTGHISRDTYMRVKEISCLVVFEKDNLGYWIYCPDAMVKEYNEGMDIPEDLWNCMLLAYENNCNWLCLDRDGSIEKSLPQFDW